MRSRIKSWVRAQSGSFWYILGCVVALTWSNINLREKIIHLQEHISGLNNAITSLEVHSATQSNQLLDQKHELSRLKGQMVIIDTAVNSDKKRKARITKTKEVIRQEVIQISSVTLTAEQISEIATAAVDYADAQEVDLALLLGLFRQESAFNPMAVSSAGAKGIGQVMDSTAEDIKSWKGRRYYNPFKISHNVEFSATYLSRMLILFDHDVEKALWAYNAGPKLVQLYLGGAVTKLPNETEKYAPAVMAFAKEFEALGLN